MHLCLVFEEDVQVLFDMIGGMDAKDTYVKQRIELFLCEQFIKGATHEVDLDISLHKAW